MSFSTRRFKTRTTKTLVRSSHSSVRPSVNVSKCPQVSQESVALGEVEASMPRTVGYKPRRTFGGKKNPKKASPPKSKSSLPVSRSSVTGVRSNPIHPIATDDFLEEMRAGLDEMGEKLKNVEKELTRQKTIGKPPSKPSAFSNKTALKKNEGSTVYNPIDFTDMDFDAAGALEVENSFDDETSGESKKNPSVSEIRHQFVPTNEAVESVIAKIRSDIKNWRISKGIEMSSNGDIQEPSVTSNRRGEIVVREEAERETPYESNRSSDGVTKVNTDSLSSDPPQKVTTKDPASLQVVKTKSPPPLRADPQGSPSFRKNTPGESSSSTLSNSMPGMRHKEPQYPLDKYLPRVLKRDDTFIKSREIPLRKDVSLFRKIDSLLKESQCIREPIVKCILAPNEAQLNVSSESSISTEDLVAAEFYKATYGTPKKADCSSKPKIAVLPHKKGAGDWVDPRNPHRYELDPKPQIETDCREGAVAMQLPWDGRNHMSALSPKTIQTETCFRPASLQTFDSCSNHKMNNEYGFNVEGTAKKLNVIDIEKPQPKPKTSEACSFYSVPSVSIPTSPSRLCNKSRTVRQISVQNAGINTDRVNTHVFSMKHPDPVVDDFAGQNRIKACVVQELPKVNIRARLVQQSCGFVSINPVHVPNECQNTAVVEMSHYNDQTEEHVGRHTSTEFSCSPKRQTEQYVQDAVVNQPPGSRDYLSHLLNSPKQPMGRTHPPAISHRLAFDMSRRCMTPQGPQPDQNTKPKIFDTASHFKEQLSRDFNSGFDSIKTSLAEMVSSLNELCDIGLNNLQGLRNVSLTSKSAHLTLKDRVDRMDRILTEELNKWGQRDSAHYNLLTKAIDELTTEIKSAVESFHQQQHLIERTNAFLEGSTATTPHQNKAENQNTAKTVHPPEPLRLDRLYAIHSYLQQSLPSSSGTQEHVDFKRQLCGNSEKGDKGLAVKIKFDETFTIDHNPPDEMHASNLQDALGEKQHSLQIENINSKGETHGDYEDDFMPEDKEDDPESDSDEHDSDSSRRDKTVEDVAAKPDENLLMRTSGSANGDESNDAPMARMAFEEPPSSVASTINASQANLKSQVKGCYVHKPIPTQPDCESRVQKNLKITDDSSDKPLVRLTNRNSNAVFELRLPEQLENLGSTLTYNSVGCNDEIKLSFGCTGSNEKAVIDKALINTNDALDKNGVPVGILNKMDLVGNSSQPKQTCDNEPFCMKYAGTCNSGHLQRVESPHRVPVCTETFPHNIPKVSHTNEATQFPSVHVESAERLSASILSLVESKINEMVETNKQKLLSQESKFKDFSVQVVPCPEAEKEPSSHIGSNTIACPRSLSSTSIHTPEMAAKLPQITPNVTPLQSDGYDSHPRNLDKPTGYLVFKQTEHEVDKMLAENRQFPVQLESSFSSISVPTSLSEFLVRSSSTSSSEMAFPLDEFPEAVSKFDDLRRLNPAPHFKYVSANGSKSNREEQSDVAELESHHSSLGDITTHLHPNPEDLAGLQTAIWVEAKEEIKEANEAVECAMPVVEAEKATTSVYEIQPYDSDLMSEGEVGYVYTSNSYSSGEIIERRKPSGAISPGTPRQKDGRTCPGDEIGNGAPHEKHSTERSIIVDQDPCGSVTTRANEENSTATSTESTTSETS